MDSVHLGFKGSVFLMFLLLLSMELNSNLYLWRILSGRVPDFCSGSVKDSEHRRIPCPFSRGIDLYLSPSLRSNGHFACTLGCRTISCPISHQIKALALYKQKAWGNTHTHTRISFLPPLEATHHVQLTLLNVPLGSHPSILMSTQWTSKKKNLHMSAISN